MNRLSEAQNHRCCYCGIAFIDIIDPGDWQLPCAPAIEHVVRRCDGGPRCWENEVAACRSCNNTRGAIPAEDFYVAVLSGAPVVKALKRAIGNRRKVQNLRDRSSWPPNLGEAVMGEAVRQYWGLMLGPPGSLKVANDRRREFRARGLVDSNNSPVGRWLP